MVELIFNPNLAVYPILLAICLCHANWTLCGRSMAGFVLETQCVQAQSKYHYMSYFSEGFGALQIEGNVAIALAIQYYEYWI